MSPPDEYVEEVETFCRRFSRNSVPDGGSLLHLGSGGGSIDYHLKRRYRVTGIDISPAMLEIARGLNPDVWYDIGDIRTADLNTTFDAVLLHDASSYMTTPGDLLLAYRAAARHLRPGGVLVTVPEEIQTLFVQHATESFTRVEGDVAVTTTIVDYDPDPSDTWYEEVFVFLIRDASGLHIEKDVHRSGIFAFDTMLNLLREAGFDPYASRWELSDCADVDRPIVTAIRR